MKKETIIVLSILAVVAIFILVIVLKKHKSSVFPLKQGSRGDEVRQLQAALNKKSDAKIDEDGIFGPKTESLLIAITGKSTITKREFKKLI